MLKLPVVAFSFDALGGRVSFELLIIFWLLILLSCFLHCTFFDGDFRDLDFDFFDAVTSIISSLI